MGLGALGLSATVAHAQTATGRIAGTVTASPQNVPLANVTVGIVGTPRGARTGNDGRYTIAGLTPGTYVVRAQLIGFTARTDTVQVAAGTSTTLDFALPQASVALQEVVVVGYGTQRRADLTGSVASVTPNVERTPITSVEQTLQGTAPGVQVTQASAAPGGGMSIRVRGGSSVIGSNEPLYVIDGFPVENDPSSASPGDAGRENAAPANPLAALNPNDIQSIDILKDASATAIYGSRGANGVVLITTKRGQGARPRVSLDTYTGTQQVYKRYDLLNASEFAEFANTYAVGQNLPVPYSAAQIAALGAGTDWQDLIFRSAPMYNVQLGVNGGSGSANQTRYALSGGVFDQQGVVQGSDFRRLSLRGNVDQMVGSRLRLGTNVLLSRVNSSQVPTDGSLNAGAGAVGAALQYSPLMPVYRADGNYTLTNTDFPAELLAINLAAPNVPNPVASAVAVRDGLFDTRALANAIGEYTILDGLKFRTTVGADLSYRGRDTYYPRTTQQGFSQGGRAIRSRVDNTSWLNENTLSYDRAFGTTHNLSAVAGYTRQQLTSVRGDTRNSNFVSDLTTFEDIGAGAQAGGPTVRSGRTRWTLASYLARVNYTLLDRYLFSVTGRRDGSSRFGSDNRWGFFPAAALGWRVSEEPFFRSLDGVGTAVSNLKLRGSVGVAGNPSISPYQSLNRLAPQQYTFGGVIAPGYQPSAIGNPELSWESTRQANVGFDLGLFEGRVDLVADYYNKRTEDLLLEIALPSEVGYSTAFVNAGSVENKGVELGVTMRVLTGGPRLGGLTWTTTFNYARNRNRVLDLGGQNRIFARSTTISDLQTGTGTSSSVVQVRQPIGAFFGYQTAGLFRDSTTLNEWRATTRLESGTPGLGNVQYVDVDGNGVVNALDRTIIGDPNPDYTLGWQNTVGFKGFELSGLLDGSFGGQVLNLNNIRLGGASPTTNVLRERVVDAWSPENPDGRWQRIGAGFGQQGTDITSEVLEDGSYLRLRTITLARAIPSRWLGGRGFEARAYVTGQNLVTWTDYSGFNPDVSSLGVGNLNRGVDVGSYPLARTFTFGLNINY